ncbi:MAG: hypothetical protein PVI57_05870 [Gemmatimonadota bacterium]|jgi:hypothetical protein
MGCAESQAEFFARITASATHEVRNVLAIVKESAGLVQDLILLAGPGAEPDRERVSAAIGRIEAQIRRGADLMSSLNRVSHGLDRDADRIELDAALRDVARLSERRARERKRGIVVLDPSCVPAVTACPLQIYMALSRTVDWSLEQVPAGGVVRMVASGDDRVPAVRVEADGGAGAFDADEWSRLVDSLDGLPASVEADDAPAAFSLLFSGERRPAPVGGDRDE